MGIFLGGAKISNFLLGCLKFLIYIGLKGRCRARAYISRKIESTPPPPGYLVSDLRDMLALSVLKYIHMFKNKGALLLVSFCLIG